ncbi:MAG: Rieske 2Fe-2S domain-containing protein [Egibacteraceae bacterium]
MSADTDPKPDHDVVGHLKVIHRTDPPASRLNDSIVLVAAGVSALLGLVFGIGLLLEAPLPLYGLALAFGLLSLGLAVRRYFANRFPDVEAVEERDNPVTDDDRAADPLSDVAALGPRRTFLKRALLAAAGVFGLPILAAPVASLGPAPGDTLSRTAWTRGRRLVTTDGQYVRPADVATGGVAGIWPEGAFGQERSAVLLLRLDRPPEPPTNLDWVVDGSLVAYSKVCTHAGCPVALFRERDEALFCPCHQSTFDTVHGAQPTFGPAARPLPQLPLGVNDSGFLIALGDFTEQVGPPFD